MQIEFKTGSDGIAPTINGVEAQLDHVGTTAAAQTTPLVVHGGILGGYAWT